MNEETPPVKYDLACGNSKQEGFLGVDMVQLEGVDVVMDLEKFPWDFKDESVDELSCRNYIEHTKDIVSFMDECWRILKPGGKLTIIAPYYNSIRAWQDPTHTRVISEATFLYYNKKWREDNVLTHYKIKSDFDYNYGYFFSPIWATRSEEAKAFAIAHYTNVVADIQINLTKR
jgi:ubiquinone/menaquinone biosynthesis C-methylase UbiE